VVRLRSDIQRLHARIEPFEGEKVEPYPLVPKEHFKRFREAFDGISRAREVIHTCEFHLTTIRGVIENIGSEVFATAGPWLEGEGNDPEELRRALRGTAGVFEIHGRVLRALADASTEDADVEQAYRGLVEGFVEASDLRIEREVAAGRSAVTDPARVAAALVWMTERLLSEKLGREPADDPDATAEALFTVWRAAIYA